MVTPNPAYRTARERSKGLAHQLFESRVAAAGASVPAEPDAEQLDALRQVAIASGAARATTIAAADVVVDERVTMKCQIPPCEVFGRNHMCPPYSPTASEFTGYLAHYRVGVLMQVQDRLPERFKELVDEREDVWYAELFRDHEWEAAYQETMMPLWHRLHVSVTATEQAAHDRGYTGAVGLAGSDCGLCSPEAYAEHQVLYQIGLGPPPSDPAFNPCDVTAPCPYPELARPAMEAVGIDVVRTLRNAGWELRFPAASYIEEGVAQWTGLVLVA